MFSYDMSKFALANEEIEESQQPASLPSTLLSEDGKIEWESHPQDSCGRCKSENVAKIIPGRMRYAASKIEDEYSAFMLFFPAAIVNIIPKK